jgi:GTPase SAR1 family protein
MKILVANKTDLPNRVIETEQGEHLAKEYGLHFFETSARTGVNINELFLYMAQQIMKDKPELTATNHGGNTQANTRPSTQNNSLA